MINFKLAQLRKSNHLTQQELGDILHVSYQTISKWENGLVSPDISVLPQISRYFGVSVDALLGLVPLEQEYIPATSGRADYWQHKLEYLKLSRKTMWNHDYIEFLIQNVWKIDKPIKILDCGCGYGQLGLLLMPLLPVGSKYVGMDFTQNMIEAAKEIYQNLEIEADFVVSDILEYHAREKFDMVISQAVLRHVNDGELFLQKMVSFVRDGGMLVSFECNREFEADSLYIQGMDYYNLCQHQGQQKMWLTELEKQNRDYSIAMKIPHYMKALGLKNVSCRMNDRVTFIEPEQSNYQDVLHAIVKSNEWEQERTEQELEEMITYFINHGMNRKEAEDYCRKQNAISKYLQKNEGEVALTKVGGILISYGWK